jgi:internalin A
MDRQAVVRLIEQAAAEGWEELDLAGLELTELPSEIGQLRQLKRLILGKLDERTYKFVGNQLTALPPELAQLHQLEELSLSHNHLTTLPEAIAQLSRLQSLNLWGNQLTTLPEAIGQLSGLQSLDLSANQLTTLPEAIGQLSGLQSLDLSANQLTTLPEAIGQLSGLQSLNLWGNQLTTLPEVIGQLSGLQSLNLSHNHLTTLPEVIGQLSGLQSLALRFNQLTTLPEVIGQLSGLQSLDLSENQLTTLPEGIGQLSELQSLDLSANQLTTLPDVIGQLSGLQSLDLSANQLTTLPEVIVQLSELQSLNLWNNQLTTMPEVIGQLTSLQELNLGYNQLMTVPEAIGQLTSLQELYLHYNQLMTVPEAIAKLTHLKTLSLKGNQLTTLPEFLTALPNLEKLDLRGNPLGIPAEILGAENHVGLPEAQPILNYYFTTRDPDQTQILYEAKLLLVGEGGAGKTSLANKLLDPDYQLKPETEDTSTQGIDILDWEFLGHNGQPYKIHIWDFGGQEIYHQTHQFFLTERACYLLVADSRKENTDHYFWLQSIELLGKDSPIHLIQNEKGKRPCTLNANQLRGEFATLRTPHRINLADNSGLDDLKTALQQELANLIPQGIPFPNKWLAVRYSLENDGRNYIDYHAYEATCRRHGIIQREEMHTLSRFLHDLGICLHFQKDSILSQRLILKPNWGTTAVYKILDNDAVKAKLGQFSDADLAAIWVDSQYADMHHQLLQLMKEFKVCYEIPRRKGHYIAPHLLSPDTPHYPPLTADCPLILRYRYSGFMPKGILTRFIVEMHQLIENVSDPQTAAVWKTGVVLNKGSSRAEVIEHYHQREIHICVIGNRPRDLLTIINHTFEAIHHRFYEDAIYDENPPFDTLVPCNCPDCKQSPHPHPFTLHKLEQLLNKGVFNVQCYESGDNNVDIRRLIDGVIFEYAEDTFSKSEPDRGARKRRDRVRSPVPSPNINVNVNVPIQTTQEQIVTNDKIWQGDKVAGNKMQINTVHGDAVAGNKIVNSQNLAQAAQDIKALIDQLASDYDTTTPSGKMGLSTKVLDAVEKNPTLKSRTLKAITEAGKTAFEEAIDHPVAKVLVAALEGYMEG